MSVEDKWTVRKRRLVELLGGERGATAAKQMRTILEGKASDGHPDFTPEATAVFKHMTKEFPDPAKRVAKTMLNLVRTTELAESLYNDVRALCTRIEETPGHEMGKLLAEAQKEAEKVHTAYDYVVAQSRVDAMVAQGFGAERGANAKIGTFLDAPTVENMVHAMMTMFRGVDEEQRAKRRKLAEVLREDEEVTCGRCNESIGTQHYEEFQETIQGGPGAIVIRRQDAHAHTDVQVQEMTMKNAMVRAMRPMAIFQQEDTATSRCAPGGTVQKRDREAFEADSRPDDT